MKITLKALWLTLKEGDFKSFYKLLNFRKNQQFIEAVEKSLLLREEKEKLKLL